MISWLGYHLRVKLVAACTIHVVRVPSSLTQLDNWVTQLDLHTDTRLNFKYCVCGLLSFCLCDPTTFGPISVIHNCSVSTLKYPLPFRDPTSTSALRGSLGAQPSLPPNGISIGLAVIVGFTSVTNRQADAVCSNSPHPRHA